MSEQVDHIVPADPDTDAWWSMENHQALARPCHSRKTLRFDGACGRTPDTSAEGKAELQRMLDAAKRRAAAIQARELIHPGGSDFLARVISRNEAAGTRETMLPQKFQTRIDD